MKTGQRSIAVLFVVVAAVAAGCARGNSTPGAGGSEATVTGSVTAPENGPPVDGFPEGSVLLVRLDDISKADAPAENISTQDVPLGDAEFPIPFELTYPTDEIDDRFTYAVSARIEYEGELLAITDTVVPVITNGAPTSGVVVPLVLTTAG